MNLEKYKKMLGAICLTIVFLCSENHCAEKNCSVEDNSSNVRYVEFLEKYNSIGADHQCILKNLPALHNASLGIGDEAAKFIAIGIKYNTVLDYVDLNHNKITAEGIKYLALPLTGKDIIQFHMNGSKIGDEGHKELAKAIKTWTNITHLNLNSTDLGDKGAEALADALRGKDKLIVFHFGSGHNMSSAGSEKLFKSLANIT